MRLKTKSPLAVPLALCLNLLLAYFCLTLCRLVFVGANLSYYPDLTAGHLWKLMNAGLVFDTSAICYGHALLILLMLFPLHLKERTGYYKIVRTLFVIINGVMIAMNLTDTVYFRYSNRRTTASVFDQFANEDNLTGIFTHELVANWYLVLLAIGLIYGSYKLFIIPPCYQRHKNRFLSYYSILTGSLLISIIFVVSGMRGGIGRDVRPITISNANQYVDRPVETAIVLNTPFSILRTLGKKTFVDPHYFDSEEALEAVFTPLHQPAEGTSFKPKNVVVLIMESFGMEYIGALNQDLEEGRYQGYTPFLDSLLTQSLTFQYSFANGQQSIDGLPSILSGIPRFVEPFFLTPASLNKLSGIGSELKKKGYYTAFFHGARNGSMGFQAYARAVGYPDYFGREDYNNEADFDGNWAIWDEEFLLFYADKMNGFQEPFATGIFTASSHHPFVIPERYKDIYPEGEVPMHKCIRYSDHALQRFFEKAAQQPWFHNTLFVITADHTNVSTHAEYMTDAGRYAVPVIFYTPDGDLKGFNQTAIAQQIDIMPTVLGYLGYDLPYISFGCDLLQTAAEDTYAVNYNNGIYQYFKGDYLLQFDGEKATALYAFKQDKLLKENLLDKAPVQLQMEQELKAIIQQYMSRMNSDRLTAAE